jgi:hypothetical protein
MNHVRVTVLSLLCVLALATSASVAEGAWVLSGQTVVPWNGLAALPLGGWPLRDACEQERAKRAQAPAELRLAAYTCLPDTADPHGPKGK